MADQKRNGWLRKGLPLFLALSVITALFIKANLKPGFSGDNSAIDNIGSDDVASLAVVNGSNASEGKQDGHEYVNNNDQLSSEVSNERHDLEGIGSLGGFSRSDTPAHGNDSGKTIPESATSGYFNAEFAQDENGTPFQAEAVALYSDGKVLTTRLSVKEIARNGLLNVQVGNPQMVLGEDNFVHTFVSDGDKRDIVTNVKVNGAGTYTVDYGIVLRNNGKTETLYFKKSFYVGARGGSYYVR